MSARPAAALVLGVALSACGGHFPVVDGARSALAADLMNYLGHAARSGPQEQKQELAIAQRDCAQPARSPACLRLGGLYAQPAPGLRDDARALDLLRRQTGTSGAAGDSRALADLAALLLVQVEERQRLARSEERKQEALRSANETLRERIRAISALERENIEREERARSDRSRRE